MDYIILFGLVINAGLNWWEVRKVQNLEAIVGQMLLDLGEKGILEVEISEDD
jgi:hypothetical protein